MNSVDGRMMFQSMHAELSSLMDNDQPLRNAVSCPGSPRSRFEDVYQQSRLVEGQDDRRRRLLKELRDSKRDETLLKKYGATFAAVLDGAGDLDVYTATDIDLAKGGADDEGEGGPTAFFNRTRETSTTPDKRSPHRRPKKKFPRLMLSEWLQEVPSDFEDSWIMLPCPTGKRCSVVTCRGETIVYSRTGMHLMSGSSSLPGGGTSKRQGLNFTVLDCVFDQRRRTFHLLDVIFWNGTSLAENTVEFRLFWLLSRLDEIESHTLVLDNDQYEMRRLPHFSCASHHLQAYFASCAATSAAASTDGYLFYHKEGLYVEETTPLVCWLKPYMIAEVLKIPVSGEFMRARPTGYTGLPDLVASMEEKRPKKTARLLRNGSEEKETLESMDDDSRCSSSAETAPH